MNTYLLTVSTYLCVVDLNYKFIFVYVGR